MKSGICVRAAALAAAVSLWASPVTAQVTSLDQLSDAQQGEIHCVTVKLSAAGDAFYDVSEAFLYDDGTPEQVKQAEAALKAASEACAAVHNWDAGKRMLGEMIGVYSSVADYLAEELYFKGVEDEEIDLIFTALEKLSPEDLNRFRDSSWIEDAAFTKKLNGALVAVKYPGEDEYILESGRLIMEASVMATAGISDWVRVYINKR